MGKGSESGRVVRHGVSRRVAASNGARGRSRYAHRVDRLKPRLSRVGIDCVGEGGCQFRMFMHGFAVRELREGKDKVLRLRLVVDALVVMRRRWVGVDVRFLRRGWL
eukprot:scaffold4569_cov117-Isochrysis_galbana.AAC.3